MKDTKNEHTEMFLFATEASIEAILGEMESDCERYGDDFPKQKKACLTGLRERIDRMINNED